MGSRFCHANWRYIILCAWIGNFIAAQMTTHDSNSGFSQVHHSGSSYFFYQQPEYPKDCEEVRQLCSFQNKSGVYLIKPDGFTAPFEVFCDNSEVSVNGGWTVILRRLDGSVGNKRTWNEYKRGFGFLGSEFWLGNDKIAYLTNQKQYELRIDMVISNGSSFHITYDKFRLTDEWSGYSLASVGEYSGSTDSFITFCNKNMEFGACVCHGTCNQPEVRNVCNNNCHQGEGCVCPDGFLFKGSDCVPENECGCLVQGRGVLSNGDAYVNDDCSSRCTCNNDVLTCENYGCSPNANCEERNDARACYCDDGFEGDGQNCTSTVRGDCLDLYNAGSRNNGVYTIHPSGWSGGAFQVYCDMTTSGGGWTVFQRRKDGNVDFYRNWNSYKTGFGNRNEEFWLGNEILHAITNQKSYELRIEITNAGGSRYHALYNLFRIDDESEKYKLVGLGSFSGTAAYDSMSSRKNRPFSTYDNDNEASSYNCAEKHRGGWWYGYDGGHYSYYYVRDCVRWVVGSSRYYCTASNLNGDYQGGNGENLFWWLDNNYYNVDCNIRFTEMKIRPV
ncbi:Ficolin-1 [Holothuria leucospilota]|uniref:Ficolin-1 n=1 Tax=Holothuria leucospilota TaxID=206669 RepID=A0A9Q1H2Z7_HOLLE|nr:Ficolin-1 [Holothuria leucospilota]